MKLDKRIIEGKKPLDCFDTDVAKQFIGKKGFFSTYDSQFMNLDTCEKCYVDELKSVDDYDDYPFITSRNYSYRLFLPEEWVNLKKKYRPYTLDEWRRTHALGTEVVFRKTRKPTGHSMPVMHRVFLGYDEGKHYLEKIHLGYSAFTLETLFEKYEIYEGGTWRPFGVNCKSDNPVSNKTILEAINKVKCY